MLPEATHGLAPSTLWLSIKRAPCPCRLSPADLFKLGCRFCPIFPLTALKIHSELCRGNGFTGGVSSLPWVRGWPAFPSLQDKLTHAWKHLQGAGRRCLSSGGDGPLQAVTLELARA